MIAHEPGTWRVLYFDVPFRGEQVRMLFAVAGQPFVDTRLNFPKGLIPYKKAALGDESPLLGTDKCPAVTAPDGTHCIETADIMRFVGQQVGLAPLAGSTEDATAVAVTLLAQQAINKIFYPLFRKMIMKRLLGHCVGSLVVGREASYITQPAAFLSKFCRSIEDTLGASGGPYVCGAKLSYADISIFASLDEVLAFDCFDRAAVLGSHPKLATLMADLEGRTQAWVDHRVREHQLGIRSSVQFLVNTNTPVPWARRAFPPSRKAEESRWSPEATSS